MKVYVDKIPKCCLDCVCCDLDLEECKIDKKIELCQDYFNSFEKKKPTKCPLHSLADYTKQVRKEVCDGLALPLIKHFQKYAEFTVEEICKWIEEYKNQIQGETK